MFRNCRPGNEKGFLLGEALIALAILTLGLLTVAEAMSTAARARARSEHAGLVAGCAQEQLIALVAGQAASSERCRPIPWNEERIPVSPHAMRVLAKTEEQLFETVTASN